jgi:hypothetical protein
MDDLDRDLEDLCTQVKRLKAKWSTEKVKQRTTGEMLLALHDALYFYQSGGPVGETQHYAQLVIQADDNEADNWMLVTLVDKLSAIASQTGRRERARKYQEGLKEGLHD